MCDPTFRDYFYGPFANFMRVRLRTVPANEVLQNIVGDPHLRAFGGRDFSECEEVLALVSVQDRPRFLVCLFIAIVSDQNVFSHFRGSYFAWHQSTLMPKFGWSGLGLHNENPLKLLRVPADLGLVDEDKLVAEVECGMPCFVQIVHDSLQRFAPNITAEDFFKSLLNDPDVREYGCGHRILDVLRQSLRRSQKIDQ